MVRALVTAGFIQPDAAKEWSELTIAAAARKLRESGARPADIHVALSMAATPERYPREINAWTPRERPRPRSFGTAGQLRTSFSGHDAARTVTYCQTMLRVEIEVAVVHVCRRLEEAFPKIC